MVAIGQPAVDPQVLYGTDLAVVEAQPGQVSAGVLRPPASEGYPERGSPVFETGWFAAGVGHGADHVIHPEAPPFHIARILEQTHDVRVSGVLFVGDVLDR